MDVNATDTTQADITGRGNFGRIIYDRKSSQKEEKVFGLLR